MPNFVTICIIIRASILDVVNALLLPLNSEPTDGPMITCGVSDNGEAVTHYWCGWACSPCQAFFVREFLAPYVASGEAEIIDTAAPWEALTARGLAALPSEEIL